MSICEPTRLQAGADSACRRRQTLVSIPRLHPRMRDVKPFFRREWGEVGSPVPGVSLRADAAPARLCVLRRVERVVVCVRPWVSDSSRRLVHWDAVALAFQVVDRPERQTAGRFMAHRLGETLASFVVCKYLRIPGGRGSAVTLRRFIGRFC